MKIIGMEVYRRKSDEEYVESIRKNMKCGRWASPLAFLTSILQFGVGCLIVRVIFDSYSPRPIFPNLTEGIGIGIALGAIACMSIFLSLHFFQHAMTLALGVRSERLLLRYHDELQALGRIP
ncbi:MAG: hypothetical protein GX455_13335 [Phycisphaerae bacterium]|nr:hypothetical protein [Phycisphaerae bacterium]